ncbi:unnamed protein product [Rotaria sp. Silwood1]|nr:unnamed protein product [Rotaria sp. Silwood1]
MASNPKATCGRVFIKLLDGVNIEIRTYEKLRDVQKSSIVNSCRMRISMKKNLQDSSMIVSRVMIEFDDLLSVLNDTQLKSALNTYKEITQLMKRARQQPSPTFQARPSRIGPNERINSINSFTTEQ